MVNPSATLVSDQTQEEINVRIWEQTQRNLAYFEQNPQEIDGRLYELDLEWDIERTLGLMSSSISLAGLALGIGFSRKWLLLPLAVQGFFLQHQTQGWCPPLPLLRSLGFRTTQEIEWERHALLSLREEKGLGPTGQVEYEQGLEQGAEQESELVGGTGGV